MRTQKIEFPSQQSLCVFPSRHANLAQAVYKLELDEGDYPVIVLIGGGIADEHAKITWRAIEIISKVAEDMKALVVCGGTDMGVMAEIGQIHWQHHYKFPLIGITPEDLVAWPGGPRNTKFLWWGKQRWQLESHYSHFILVPGNEFGDESQWIVSAATMLSKGRPTVTILINGGEVSRKDIELSLKNGRPVIALSHTGRLADEYAENPNRHKLITIVPANAEKQLADVIQTSLSARERSAFAQFQLRGASGY